MKQWSTARWRRIQQYGCYLAALGFPTYLLKTNPKAISPSVVALIGLLFTCAGTLSSPTRGQQRAARPSKDGADDRRNDDEPEEESPLDPLVRKMRQVVREHLDWPEGNECVAAFG